MERAVNRAIPEAANDLSEQLTRLSVPHAVVGGLAVIEHGVNRTTTDLDFLVLKSDLRKIANLTGGVGVQNMPAREGGTSIYRSLVLDLLYLTPHEVKKTTFGQELRYKMLGPPVVSQGGLFYLKLQSSRAKDWGDVVELLKAGRIDRDVVKAYLGSLAPLLLNRFDAAIVQAESELAAAAKGKGSISGRRRK